LAAVGEAEATEMRLKANAYQRHVFINIIQIAIYLIGFVEIQIGGLQKIT